MSEKRELRKKRETLVKEHRRLDELIEKLSLEGSAFSIEIQRLKKKKLMLKDQIAQIDDLLTPDIIA